MQTENGWIRICLDKKRNEMKLNRKNGAWHSTIQRRIQQPRRRRISGWETKWCSTRSFHHLHLCRPSFTIWNLHQRDEESDHLKKKVRLETRPLHSAKQGYFYKAVVGNKGLTTYGSHLLKVLSPHFLPVCGARCTRRGIWSHQTFFTWCSTTFYNYYKL